MRKQVFLPTVGNFLAPQFFDQALQPSVILAALEGRTKFNYMQGRTSASVAKAALETASKQVGGSVYHAPTISVTGDTPIPYSNRGTYIQIVEMLIAGPYGRNVLPPGVSAAGPHSNDQVPLSRAWIYKPMRKPD
jgi:hypothetical protein